MSYFIDLTPYLELADGQRIELGTVRYEVPDEYVTADPHKTTGSFSSWMPGHVYLTGSYNLASRLSVSIITRNADIPQPQQIESVKPDGDA